MISALLGWRCDIKGSFSMAPGLDLPPRTQKQPAEGEDEWSDFNSSMFRNRYLLYWSFWNDFFVFIFWTAQHSPSDPRCPLLWRQWRKGGRTRSAPNALNWSSVTWETGSSRRKRLPSALDWSACARSRRPRESRAGCSPRRLDQRQAGGDVPPQDAAPERAEAETTSRPGAEPEQTDKQRDTELHETLREKEQEWRDQQEIRFIIITVIRRVC